MTAAYGVRRWRVWTASFAVAGLLWLAVFAERPSEGALSASVELVRVPPGLSPAAPVPECITLTVSGPRIVLWRLRLKRPVCRLDLAGAVAGRATFPAPQRFVKLDQELEVRAAQPAALTVTLVTAAGR